MSEEGNEKKSRLTLQIPTITQDSQCQTLGHLVSRSKSSEKANVDEMETQNISIKKRRNLSKNRGQTARQREKTPEPGRTPIPHEDTPTSDDEDYQPRNSREIEADNTYEEMKRLVQEQSGVKDPVYDLDTEAVIEARAMAANERRRRSVSPFAVIEKEREVEPIGLQRKGSFIDPTNKLLSTMYTLSPKDEDTGRRGSLTFELPPERKRSLTPSTPTTASPKDTNFPYPFPSTPKKLEEMVYPDEQAAKTEDKPKLPKTPVKKDVFTFDQKDEAQDTKQEKKPVTKPKTPEAPATPGELVTKVYQIERTPSRKMLPENKPAVEIRERVVRTPSRKLTGEGRPNIVKQVLKSKDEPPQTQSKVPPVKPARSKSATRFGGKTSESEMSEDQINQQNLPAQAARRKVLPTPRRFVKNRSPRANRSQSVNRVEDVKVIDKTGTGMSQTSKEIIELMQQARARSLSISKDDPRLPQEYRRDYNKNLQTPNKTPSTPRRTRGISCPKTIQIISDKEILFGLTPANKASIKSEKQSRQSSGYIDASQSEYTSSCYSTSPSENEYDFDLSERTAELTRKLHLLSQEVDKRENRDSIILTSDNNTQHVEHKSGLRKRSIAEAKNGVKKEKKEDKEKEKQSKTKTDDEKKKSVRSKWKLIANWRQFKEEQKSAYKSIIRLRNQCICDFILLITLCGLGGMMFRTFEGSFENTYKCSTRNVKRDFIENLWRGSHYLREEDWKSMARSKLYEFENQLHTAHEAGVTSFSGQRSWNFMNSFVYCLTLITTIGYGHITPKTLSGRIATIVYAIVGIPLFLIVLADFGKLFTRIIKFLWSFIRRFYYTRSCRSVRRVTHVEDMVKGLNMVADVVRRPSQIFNTEDLESKLEGNGDPPKIERKPSDVPPPLPPKPGQLHTTVIEDSIEPETPAPSDFIIDEEFNLPISIAIFILVLYIVIGALGYDIWEKWGFFESFYFVFISMTTIGLGDYVPKHPLFMMMSILYLVFGLALMSMCINVVQVKLSDTFKTASRKIADTVGLPIAEEESLTEGNPVPPIEIAPVHKSKNKTDEDKSNEGKENENKDKFVQINCD
ncbi:uncharacterized protein LOC133529584 isoform X1 [Cydia pomonella]|uniref:uncharacterized protein LOC133529584 isoform X1 n=1 Tax=Cydia pomonella TaxID=82600 RepID=UPI002ADE7871|nr:uncharacterized protein LOC133529584 isoform X1 [Cydia pomonella]